MIRKYVARTTRAASTVLLLTLSYFVNDAFAASAAVVYVETNSPNGNAILSFARDADGALTLIATTPTGGNGVFDLSLALGPFDSDQNLITNAEHTKLFAVNSGSNSVAVFNIAADGGLSPAPFSPYFSGGRNPVSIGLMRDAVAIVNKAMDPEQPAVNANYSSFRLNPAGQINHQLSAVPVSPDFSATQALVSPSQRHVFGADFLGGKLRSFLVGTDGSLDQTSIQSPPDSAANGATKALPLGLAAHPRLAIVYVGFVTVNKLAVYTYDERGRLTFVGTAPNSGQAICWLRTNADGTRLYSSNTTDNSISVYDITTPLQPVEIQHLPLKGNGNAFQLDLDPSGDFLYVVTQRATEDTPLGEGTNLHVLRVNRGNGKLSASGLSPLALPVSPAGTRPQGVVAVQTR